jgi:hypothetical protein
MSQVQVSIESMLMSAVIVSEATIRNLTSWVRRLWIEWELSGIREAHALREFALDIINKQDSPVPAY